MKILKEEVRDLLDPASTGKLEAGNGNAGKVSVPGKPPVQIREASNGVITLAGSTEIDVNTQTEMAACLEQGSLSRATGSTNMNNQSRYNTKESFYVFSVWNSTDGHNLNYVYLLTARGLIFSYYSPSFYPSAQTYLVLILLML